ncbi:hypothetical protein [Ralstonia sp. 24A2]|uniref:hypothetical protein n=1 Tax=Ralstonia sp. 24A2 TaxID=3447364 RepID=UPI003F6A0678
MKKTQLVGFPVVILVSLVLAACGGGGDNQPATGSTSGSNSGSTGGSGGSGGGTGGGTTGGGTTPQGSNLECDPVYQASDTVNVHLYTQATATSPVVDGGVFVRTYSSTTFQGTSLTQQVETGTGSTLPVHDYYLVGNGTRTHYGSEAYQPASAGGGLALRDVYTPPYVEAIGLATSESISYLDAPTIPTGGLQSAVSTQRTYIGRETVNLKNGKSFSNVCHYQTTQTASNSVRTVTTTADEWFAPGVGMIRTVANIGGITIVTRELESATVAGKTY